MPLPDFWLVRRARAGDHAAFGVLYDRHGPRVHGLLLRLSGDPTVAEDVTQETFLSAYRSLHAWRGVGAFPTWLCGIAVRCYRNDRRRRPAEDPLDDSLSAPDATADPLARYTQAEARRALDAAIAALPAACREAFVLVYVEGLAYRETADLLGVPLGTVQSRLHRAKGLLQTRLAHLSLDAPPERPRQEGDVPPKGANSHVS